MRIYITGGAGFIGLAVVRRLVARGDRVTATIRDPTKAGPLRDLGADIRVGDLSRAATIVEAMRGADTAIHLAGDYRVGIPASERPAMHDANVGITTRVLDAARRSASSASSRISTVNVFGDTHDRIVDEKFRRDLAERSAVTATAASGFTASTPHGTGRGGPAAVSAVRPRRTAPPQDAPSPPASTAAAPMRLMSWVVRPV